MITTKCFRPLAEGQIITLESSTQYQNIFPPFLSPYLSLAIMRPEWPCIDSLPFNPITTTQECEVNA